MSTKITVKMDVNQVTKEFERSFNRARQMMKSEIAKDTDSYTPKNKGKLIQSLAPSIRANDQYLIWNKPYARFLYHGRVMIGEHSRSAWAKKYEQKIVTSKRLKYSQYNANAGPFWFERAKQLYVTKWIKTFSKGAKR